MSLHLFHSLLCYPLQQLPHPFHPFYPHHLSTPTFSFVLPFPSEEFFFGGLCFCLHNCFPLPWPFSQALSTLIPPPLCPLLFFLVSGSLSFSSGLRCQRGFFLCGILRRGYFVGSLPFGVIGMCLLGTAFMLSGWDWDRESIDEKLSFRMVYPRECGGTFAISTK